MITRLLIGLLATACAALAQAPASTAHRVGFYATPSVVIAFPGDFDNAVGGALAFGATINDVHAIEAEVISFKTKEFSDDFRFTPVLATYKYRLLLNEKLSLVVGASLGATFEKNEYVAGPYPFMPAGSGTATYSRRETAFTSGLLGGISFAFNNRASIEANAHLLRLEETDITTSGNMVLLTVGMKFHF